MWTFPSQEVGDSAKAELAYRNNCMICHGPALEGGFGPALSHVGSRKTKAQIVRQIQNGGVLMPAFRTQLDAGTIQVLAEWLFAKK
nr:cytochrome c [Brevibacillus sp. SYP-B805]